MIGIYGLKDPRDDLCRYCGSSRDPVQRAKKHVSQILRNGTHRNADLIPWVLELKDLGLKPQVVIFEWVEEDEANEAEKLWSRELLKDGHPLKNKILGGAGTNRNRREFSDEHREKLSAARSGKTFDDNWRRNLSEAHKGKPGNRLGTKQSEETRAKMRAAWDRRRQG